MTTIKEAEIASFHIKKVPKGSNYFKRLISGFVVRAETPCVGYLIFSSLIKGSFFVPLNKIKEADRNVGQEIKF